MSQSELEQMVTTLKGRLDDYEKTDRFIYSKLVQFLDGRNIQLGRTTGTMIGTASDQKLGFFGHAPVAQQSHISAPSGGTTVDSSARTAINQIISLLQTLGLTS
jgi:hypothetical protein